jgi:hypothetical protein
MTQLEKLEKLMSQTAVSWVVVILIHVTVLLYFKLYFFLFFITSGLKLLAPAAEVLQFSANVWLLFA